MPPRGFPIDQPRIEPPLQTTVLLRRPSGEVVTRPLRDVMLIGRVDENDLATHDPHTNRRAHARVTRQPGGQLVLEDLASTNGTLLEGRMLAPSRGSHGAADGEDGCFLHVGDQIQVGGSIIAFEHTLTGAPWPAEARPLLDAVLEAPTDDAPRSVLADWLGERGDPRGELITCQLAGTPTATARASELLRYHHRWEWVAPLPVPVHAWRVERGFLARVWVRDVAAAEALRALHPLVEILPIDWRVAPLS